MQSVKELHGFVTTCGVVRVGAKTDRWFGGLFGLLTGATFPWIPGFGPLLVAGSFAGMLLGNMDGVIAGEAGCGLLDALVGWGVSKQYILKYEEHLKGGKDLLMTYGSTEEAIRDKKFLQGSSSPW